MTKCGELAGDLKHDLQRPLDTGALSAGNATTTQHACIGPNPTCRNPESAVLEIPIAPLMGPNLPFGSAVTA